MTAETVANTMDVSVGWAYIIMTDKSKWNTFLSVDATAVEPRSAVDESRTCSGNVEQVGWRI